MQSVYPPSTDVEIDAETGALRFRASSVRDHDFYIGARRGKPDCIAHYVLDRSTQLFPAPVVMHDSRESTLTAQLLPLAEVPVNRNFLNQAAQFNYFLAA